MSLSGDTEILTRTGPQYIKDIGSETELWVWTLDKFHWVKCSIECLGLGVTVPVSIGHNYPIRVTLDNDWFYCHSRENYKLNHRHKKKTYELICNNYLPLAPMNLSKIDWEGYARGFVFGDGCQINNREKLSCSVVLYKNDKDLIELLARFGNIGSTYIKNFGYLPTVTQLPEDWKELPGSLTRSYSLGFILGLISADGHLNKESNIRIFQSDLENMFEIRRLAIYAGLRAREIKLGRSPEDSNFKNAKQNYVLTIGSYNLTKNHFLRQDQKQRFKTSSQQYTSTVRNIDFDDKIKEPIFKVIVPSYRNFALADFTVIGT